MKKIIPQLAIALTDKCNMRCFYCHTGGANLNFNNAMMTGKTVISLLKIAYERGFRTFRMTGGEPTLHPEWQEILREIEKFGPDTKILFTTNGINLEKYVEFFASLRNINVFISVDSITHNYRGYPKKMNPSLSRAIKKLAPKVYTRINMVVTKTTKDSVTEMIDFCVKNSIDLKLHDLYYCEEIINPDEPSYKFWKKEFFSLSKIVPELKKRSDRQEVFPGHGPYGIPMTSYFIGKIKVITKDSTRGTHYAKTCTQCPLYPCRHGLYVPQISSDGYLYPSNCAFKKNIKKIAGKSKREVSSDYDFMINLLTASKLVNYN